MRTLSMTWAVHVLAFYYYQKWNFSDIWLDLTDSKAAVGDIVG